MTPQRWLSVGLLLTLGCGGISGDPSLEPADPIDPGADMTSDAPADEGGALSVEDPLALCDQEPADWPSRPRWGELTSGVADYQDVMNNFNILDSLRLLASMLDKIVTGINGVTAGADDEATGHCVCSCPAVALAGNAWSTIPSNPGDLSAWATAQGTAFTTSCYDDELTRAQCITKCDAAGATGFSAGNINTNKNYLWAPSDVLVNPDLSPKYALKLIDFLDEVTGFLSAGGACTTDADCSGDGAVCDNNVCKSGLRQVLDAMSTVGANLTMAVQNVIDSLQQIFNMINRFTEGYHLGGYSTQRPDLHLCVGWAGHGAYAQMGNLGGDKFSIGARYTSHQLSYKHRAQFRSGGFGVQALGKSLSLLPTPEANIQIDGFRMWNADKPFGITMPPGGINISDIEQHDVFHLVDSSELAQLAGSDNDPSTITVGELLINDYYPALYDSASDNMTYTWPRSMADTPASWLPWAGWPGEARSDAVFSAGLNLPLAIEPIERSLPTIPIFPPYASLEPYFRLGAGVEWIHEAFRFRDLARDMTNINLPAGSQLELSDFNREQHALQAPDVSEDNLTTAYVEPGIGANLSFGLQLSKFAKIGLGATIGFSVKVQPGGWGGLLDMNYAMVNAILNSNPPQDAPCTPIWESTTQKACSNTFHGEHSQATYACSTDGVSSCCMSFGDVKLCVEDWTGIDRGLCTQLNLISEDPDKINGYINTISSFIGPSATAALEAAVAAGAQVSSSWNQGQTCAESSCNPTIALPSLDSLSTCEQHGYCADANDQILAYDVTEATCLGTNTAPGQGRCCTKYDNRLRQYGGVACTLSQDACEAQQGVFVPGGICSSNVNLQDCSNPDDDRLGGGGLQWFPYICTNQVTPEVTGWEGDGCHPLSHGFPSACGCGSDADCVAGETCGQDGVCEGSAGYACLCDPGDSSSCVAGRTCVDGGCHKQCSADADCSGAMTCEDNLCKPKHGIATAESIVWGTKNGEAPRHAVTTYAFSDLLVLLSLHFGIDLGLQIKLFGKGFTLNLFDYSDTVDLGSTHKGWYQGGLEARYQSECADPADQLVSNRMPAPLTSTFGLNIPSDGHFAGYVNRYPDPGNTSLDPTLDGNACHPTGDTSACTWEDLVGWCKQEVGNNVFNPEPPNPADLGDALNQTLDWGEEIGLQVWETGQMCINGEPWYMWSQNASGSLEQLDCMYQDPQTGTTHTFACASADTALLGIWGCLDTDLNIYAAQLATQAGPGVTTNSGQQFNPQALMIDPAGEFAVHNIKPQYLFAGIGPPVGYLWMLSVEQCFTTQHELSSRCSCDSATDCPEDTDSCGADGYCRTSANAYASCPAVGLLTPPQIEPCCGDGTMQPGEQCDDGNTTPGDGCSSYCTKEDGGGEPPRTGACCARRGDGFTCLPDLSAQDCAKYDGATHSPGLSCDQVRCPAP